MFNFPYFLSLQNNVSDTELNEFKARGVQKWSSFAFRVYITPVVIGTTKTSPQQRNQKISSIDHNY